MTVGENIQKYRKKLGMSQEELGKKITCKQADYQPLGKESDIAYN